MRPLALISLLLLPPAAAADPPSEDRLWVEAGPRRPAAAIGLPSLSRLVRQAGPAVVNVTTVLPAEAKDAGSPRAAPRGRGQGTGFVIHASGLILTNSHVVAPAESIKVRLADEREFAARIVGSDQRTDIALLKIEAAGLPTVTLGDSDAVEIGEWVIAIGNPFGLDHTVTVGIVSGKGRQDVRPGGGRRGYYDFIQTDASVNVGNSGGPLINSRGEVIGINTAVNPQGAGIAFAIPINMAKAIVPQLHRHGRVRRGWMGLMTQPVTQALRQAFGLPSARGALISEVVPGSPAAQAGIASGDTVVEFDGRPVQRADDLQWLISIAGPGKQARVRLLRHGQPVELDVTLGDAPDEASRSAGPAPEEERRSPLGVTVTEITAGIARQMGQPGLRGLVVTGVEPTSPARDAGVERGDLVLRVGDAAVTTIDDYSRAIHDLRPGDLLRLLVRREERTLWLAFPRR